ncbi:tRNA ligase kinase domain-containing protein [Glomus cerebriforme]|uniref:tRNA ligase kinase domain-containing protein n=1 Tax=Glomus cerebriforme TaxID=658196 RepID=A0A397TTM2_9GLOM|nr:tRNA ligase kinase domain-containing protein [Glomus cerebriforme]
MYKINPFYKTLLVPIATIGCGKTTLALALAKLFSFGHIQNDDIVGKRRRKKFYNNINVELENRDVVIADRNNHMKELRKTLIEAVKTTFSNVRVVAIYWNHENRTPNEIIKITSERIITRGQNHQSFTVENKGQMWNFLNKFEPLDLNDDTDRQFDHVIYLDVANDIYTNLRIVINELRFILGFENPHEYVIKSVLEEIKHYKVNVCNPVRKPTSKYSKRLTRRAQYYGIALDFNVQSFLTNYYGKHPDEDSGTFDTLVEKNRIKSKLHVTLIHSSQMKKNIELWEYYEKLCENSSLGVKVYIDKIVFNPQIMALVVNRFDPQIIHSTNKVAHITVGTVHRNVKAVRSNNICESALFGIHGEENPSEIRVINLERELVVKGVVKAF